ncbi:MAG TPA: SCO family protein [Xanthobacteraceae bacterium]|nr:SCO family protein [Xanthobacteraceae bacterium]
MTRTAGNHIGRMGMLAGSIGLGMLVSAASLQAAAADDDLDLAFRPHPGERLPLATRLVDQQGRAVMLGDFFGKSPVILVLDYLRCTSLCGLTLHNLVVDALARLPLVPGRDYQLVTISIDPRDTPADAAAAQAKYVDLLDRREPAVAAGQGLHFLTAPSADAARAVADAVGFPYRYDKLIDAYIHPAGFVLVSPKGRISRYVEGVAISPQELVAALGDSEADKSIGPLTRLLLICHQQLGRIGRLTVPVLAAFTIANLAAVAALVALFAAIWRRRHG